MCVYLHLTEAGSWCLKRHGFWYGTDCTEADRGRKRKIWMDNVSEDL